jgi:hypothetical protein
MDDPNACREPATPRPDDETRVTEIEVTADGRIFVFGTSLEVLEVLGQLPMADQRTLDRRIRAGHGSSTAPSSTRRAERNRE